MAPHRDPHAALRKAERLAHLLDSKYRIPLTNIRFGLDTIIGLVPGVGDIATLAIGLAIPVYARRHGAPLPTLAKMGVNLAADTLVGTIPLIGDAADIAFRANHRNALLLKEHLEQQAATTPKPVANTAADHSPRS